MRSKGQGAIAASSDGVVPKLRFSGFEGAWPLAAVRDLYEFKSTNTLSRDKLNYKEGGVRNIHYGDIHTKFSPRFILANEKVPFVNDGELSSPLNADSFCVAGDMVLADASEDVDDVGKSIEIIDLHGERVVAGLHTILARRIGGELTLGFGAYLFRSPAVREQIKRESQGAKVLGISPTRLGNVLLPYPRKSDEQQKIADCLASLDARICAERCKLDALKTHKQGLMQQLFPVEGERLPRLRFPEFRDKKDWTPIALGQIANFQSGGTPSKENPAFWTGSIPWVSAKDMKKLFLDETEDHITMDAIESGAKQVPARTVLMLVRGMTLLKDVPVCIINRQMSFNQDVKAIRPKGEVEGPFLAYLLLSRKQRLLSMVDIAGHGTGRLDTDELKALDVGLPQPAEQERIAVCLSSLEDLIASQSRKIEAIQQHKQGLMQGLFPAMGMQTA